MSSTAHKSEAEKKERFDSPEELEEKIALLAEMVQKSQHFIVFTGAGVSTSAGIPDFRSGVNTVLDTGPGAWEKQATGYKKAAKVYVDSECALPTRTHMAFTSLEKKGLLKAVISQNTDGIHRRSGFPPEKLAELHGNTNLEICKACKREYLRDFWTPPDKNAFKHKTGRDCENCGKELYDNIVHFGEMLPEKDLDFGFVHAQLADLCICLGSSLKVSPANEIPQTVTKKPEGKLVVVNLQPTPLDHLTTLRIWGMCDTVMEALMKKLEIDIPKFTLKRWVGVKRRKDELCFRGVGEDGSSFTFLTKIRVNKRKELNTEPFTCKMPKKKESISVLLFFVGNFGEGELKLEIALKDLKDDTEQFYQMEFDPYIRKWISVGRKE